MKVLAIAPYKELLPLVEEVASEYPDIDLTLSHGDLDDALISALTVFHEDFNVVISRGGTAEALEEEFSVPIVSIDVSIPDILNCLRRAGGKGVRIAAVGFQAALKNVPAASELSGRPIDCFPIDYEDELPLALDRAAEGGYDLVLGDTAAWKGATERGMRALLLASGAESVRDAFDRAELIFAAGIKSDETSQLLRDVIHTQGIRLALFSSDGRLVYSTLSADDTPILSNLKRYAGEENPPKRFLFRHAGTLYTARALARIYQGARVTAFTVTSESIPGRDRMAGITYFSRGDIEKLYRTSTFCILGATPELEKVLKRAGENARPIFLEGETGSGKPRAAQLLYLSSAYAEQPYIEIDCDLIDSKSWEFLTSNYRSPLYESNAFLHIRSLHRLTRQRAGELMAIMQRSLVAKRCKLVFSFNLEANGEEPEIAYRISEQLDCFTIVVPPLRKMHIPGDAAEHYLATLAERDGRDAPTLDDEAARIVANYHWPRNILQFKQVLNWAYASTENNVITGEVMRQALNRDASARFSNVSTPDSESVLDILKPLSETTAEIARIVVESCGGNKTLAAKTLGISRTTLWNMLKR